MMDFDGLLEEDEKMTIRSSLAISEDFEKIQKSSSLIIKSFIIDEKNKNMSNDINEKNTSSKYPLLRNENFTAFSQGIIDEFTKIEVVSKMGILTDIKRVWLSIDNKLYFWDYRSKDNNANKVVYESSEVIVSLALCVPKYGVFAATVNYILVVATTIEVVIVALEYNDNDNFNQIELTRTPFNIQLEGIFVNKIIGTSKGRIFLAGSDRNLFELCYENAVSDISFSKNLISSYFGTGGDNYEVYEPKCQKIQHNITNWKILPFLSNLLTNESHDENRIIHLCVDDSRKYLHVISSKLILSIFTGINDLDNQLQLVIPEYDIIEEAKRYLNNKEISSEFIQRNNNYIIGVDIIPVIEQFTSLLLILFDCGLRLYLKEKKNNGIVVKIEISHVKFSQNSDDHNIKNIHTSFYSNEILVYAMGYPNTSNTYAINDDIDKIGDKLFCVYYNQEYKEDDVLQFCVCPIETKDIIGEIMEINEEIITKSENNISFNKDYENLFITSKTPNYNENNDFDNNSYLTHHQELARLNKITRERISKNREILVLTRLGLHKLIENRPIDTLHSIIKQYFDDRENIRNNKSVTQVSINDVSNKYFDSITDFFTYYGSIQSCAICYSLASCYSESKSNIYELNVSKEVAEEAIKIVSEYGGSPSYSMDTISEQANVEQSSNDMALSVIVHAQSRQINKLHQDNEILENIIKKKEQSNEINIINEKEVCKVKYSNKLSGLLLIVSRLLRPFWLRSVFENDYTMMNTWSEEIIINSFKPLEVLYHFIDKEIKESKYIPKTKLMPPTMDTKHDDYTIFRYTRMKEFQTLQELKLFIEKIFHGFALVSLLYDINNNHHQDCSKNFGDLKGVTFQGIVISQYRHEQLRYLLSSYLRSIKKNSDDNDDDFKNITDAIKKKLSAINNKKFHGHIAKDSDASFYYSLGDHNICKTLRLLLNNNYNNNFIYLVEYSQKYMIQREDVILQVPYKSNLVLSCEILYGIYEKSSKNSNILNQSLCCLTELCLKVANNFLINEPNSKDVNLNDVIEPNSNLYQRRNRNENINLITNQYCYRLLLNYLKDLVNSQDSIKMIVTNAVALWKKNKKYLSNIFCKELYEGQDNWKEEVLIRIKEDFVEEYLSHKDSKLLHKYYEEHLEFEKAAEFAYRIATKDDNFSIDDRIFFLDKSCKSIVEACARNNQLEEMKIKFFDALMTAKLQKEIYSILQKLYNNNEKKEKKDKLLQDQLFKLLNPNSSLLSSLLSSSHLLHTIANPYNLWEYCLQLLNTNNLMQDRDPIFITTLWKSYIFKMIPQKAKTTIGKDFLKLKRISPLLLTEKSVLQFSEKPVLQSYFEDNINDWTANMIESIVDLSKKIYTTNNYNKIKIDFKIDDINEYGCSKFVLPIDVIMEELITIVVTIHNIPTIHDIPARELVSNCLKAIGIPIDIRISFFIRLSYTWIGQNFDKQLQIASSISKELIDWFQLSENEKDKSEIKNVIRNGLMNIWVEYLRNFLFLESTSKVQLFQKIREEFDEIRDFVDSLTIN